MELAACRANRQSGLRAPRRAVTTKVYRSKTKSRLVGGPPRSLDDVCEAAILFIERTQLEVYTEAHAVVAISVMNSNIAANSADGA